MREQHINGKAPIRENTLSFRQSLFLADGNPKPASHSIYTISLKTKPLKCS
jgi:hypothetical protein